MQVKTRMPRNILETCPLSNREYPGSRDFAHTGDFNRLSEGLRTRLFTSFSAYQLDQKTGNCRKVFSVCQFKNVKSFVWQNTYILPRDMGLYTVPEKYMFNNKGFLGYKYYQ